MMGWSGADPRHNPNLPDAARNTRMNELNDHYSVGADLGPLAGPVLGVLMEGGGRSFIAKHPDLANALAPSVFNLKTEYNQRPGSIAPYTPPTDQESADNLRQTLAGSLDKYPQLQKLLGL